MDKIYITPEVFLYDILKEVFFYDILKYDKKGNKIVHKPTAKQQI